MTLNSTLPAQTPLLILRFKTLLQSRPSPWISEKAIQVDDRPPAGPFTLSSVRIVALTPRPVLHILLPGRYLVGVGNGLVSVAQAILKLLILLPQSPESWNYRRVPLYQTRYYSDPSA